MSGYRRDVHFGSGSCTSRALALSYCTRRSNTSGAWNQIVPGHTERGEGLWLSRSTRAWRTFPKGWVRNTWSAQWLSIKCTRYARYQHEGLDLKHPSGGEAKYLEGPLYQRHRDYLQRLADHTLTGDLTRAMVDNVEALSLQVYDLAPREFHDLRASGHPTVTDAGAVAYDRPPNVHRLTDVELRAKAELRALGFGHEF